MGFETEGFPSIAVFLSDTETGEMQVERATAYRITVPEEEPVEFRQIEDGYKVVAVDGYRDIVVRQEVGDKIERGELYVVDIVVDTPFRLVRDNY